MTDKDFAYNLTRMLAFEITQARHPDRVQQFTQRWQAWLKSGAAGTAASSEFDAMCRNILDTLTSGRGDLGGLLEGEPLYLNERLERYRYGILGAQNLSAEVPLKFDSGPLVGSSPPWLEALELAARAAACDFPVLISGETGVGKDLTARQIHANSSRASGPYITVNCAALPDNLLETELFGYSGGAFTGARRRGHTGRLEEAAGGTLVLDEITELPARAQAALLRALQNGEIQKVGGATFHADFRLICISNRPLERDVDSGAFRRDLFYRIAVIPLVIPTLREHPEDIPALVEHFLQRFLSQKGGVVANRLSPESLDRLRTYAWPGNIRELENVIARAMILCRDTVITSRHLIFSTPVEDSIVSQSLSKLETRLGRAQAELNLKLRVREAAQFLSGANPGITTSNYARRFGCSHSTARRHLEALREYGLLNKTGSKKSVRYSLIE